MKHKQNLIVQIQSANIKYLTYYFDLEQKINKGIDIEPDEYLLYESVKPALKEIRECILNISPTIDNILEKALNGLDIEKVLEYS